MRDEPDNFVRSATGAAVVAELRQDIVSGCHVLVAPSRSDRPSTVSRPRRAELSVAGHAHDHPRHDCPFCSGNERSTAEELYRTGTGSAGEPGWRVRVVRNRYPVVGGAVGATGECEVVVFSDHDRRLEDLEVDDVAEILAVIRDRVAAQSAQRSSVHVFVNAEADAGASIAHPHAQIISLDFVPPALELEFDMIRALGHDPLQLDLETADARELIVVEGETPAWCPSAMPLPYGVRIAPRGSTSFVDLNSDEIASVAQTLSDVVRAVNALLDRPAYNVVIFDDQVRDDLHRRWRIEVVPRITVGGGFEISTAVTTNSTEGSDAARSLRLQLEHNRSSDRPTTAMRAHS